MTFTPEEIARLRQIIAVATPGLWSVRPVKGYTDDEIITDHPARQTDPHGNHVADVGHASGHQKQNFQNDSAFIAAARLALPVALDEIERQRVEIEWLTANQCCIGEALVIEDGKMIGCHPENQLRQMEGHTDELGSEIQSLRDRIAELEAMIADPAAVWVNMLCGTIAKPQGVTHLEQRVAEMEAERDRQTTAKTLDEWHEDYGDVLWWKFPVEESPCAGSPLDRDWPDYHTHWTPLPPIPKEPMI